MNKIYRCLIQKKGINLIEPKLHLSKAYMKEADETLENVFCTKGKWKTITAYYACYNAIYSLLMKSGIKSEIHDCTIELMKMFGFSKQEIEFMKRLKNDRIQVQYYLKEIFLDNELMVKKFISRCKVLLDSMNSEKIENIRNEIKQLIKECGHTDG